MTKRNMPKLSQVGWLTLTSRYSGKEPSWILKNPPVRFWKHALIFKTHRAFSLIFSHSAPTACTSCQVVIFTPFEEVKSTSLQQRWMFPQKSGPWKILRDFGVVRVLMHILYLHYRFCTFPLMGRTDGQNWMCVLDPGRHHRPTKAIFNVESNLHLCALDNLQLSRKFLT